MARRSYPKVRNSCFYCCYCCCWQKIPEYQSTKEFKPPNALLQIVNKSPYFSFDIIRERKFEVIRLNTWHFRFKSVEISVDTHTFETNGNLLVFFLFWREFMFYRPLGWLKIFSVELLLVSFESTTWTLLMKPLSPLSHSEIPARRHWVKKRSHYDRLRFLSLPGAIGTVLRNVWNFLVKHNLIQAWINA